MNTFIRMVALEIGVLTLKLHERYVDVPDYAANPKVEKIVERLKVIVDDLEKVADES